MQESANLSANQHKAASKPRRRRPRNDQAEDGRQAVPRPVRPLPALSYPDDLPVSGRRQDIADAIRANQVVIVCGETGSGKTTQLPKICLELGRGQRKIIGHTQPRRLAATSVAKRIAQELKTELGDWVGYQIRFSDRSGPGTAIKLMTDGILLAESQRDPMLRRYDTIIIDEAHERSLNIDFFARIFKAAAAAPARSQTYHYVGNYRRRPLCQPLCQRRQARTRY